MSKFTLDWLKSVSLAEFKAEAGKVGPGSQELADLNALLSSPEGRQIASDMVNDPDYVPVSKRQPTEEEAAQIAADIAEAERQAAEQEAARAAAAAAEAAKTAAPKTEDRKKIVVEYQATDEDGKPIGRPTHIEGWTHEEVIEKLQQAHVNAVRYAERVKKNRVRESATAVQAVETSAAIKVAKEESAKLAAEAVNEKDPVKMQEAVKKSVEAEREAKIVEETMRQHGRIIADTWMSDHEHDFVPCLANSNILGEYLQKNNLPLTYENLEKAFKATENQLSKPSKAPVEAVPAAVVTNSSAAAPAATPAATPSITAPVAEAVVTENTATPAEVPPSTAPAPNSTPVAAAKSAEATRRPGVNGSVMPGTMSAARPVVQQQPTDTRATLLKEIAKMPAQEYRKKLRDPNYVKKLQAAGIPVVGSRT